MTRPLFEQYKDALRRGHLAARASKLDEALAAYAEAARLAPDRAAPHTSAATTLHRAGRDADALASFDRALAIAADDEVTLRARAAVFRDMGRLASAAADLERLAEALDADGRRADAVAAAREALILTATPARRVLVERLEAPEDDSVPRPRPELTARKPAVPAPAPVATPTLAAETPPEAPRSSSTLLDLYDTPIADAPVGEDPTAARIAALAMEPAAEPAGVSGADATTPSDAPQPEVRAAAGPTPATLGDADAHVAPLVPEMAALNAPTAGRISLDPAVRDPGSDFLIQLEPDVAEGAAIPWPAIDLPSAPPPPIVGPPPDPEILMAEALSLIDGGDPKAARNLMLTAVMVHRAAGRPDAAIDVCLQLLALFPGDAHVHLAIAGLQLDRGWRTLATEKISLLLRLTSLTGDTQAEADAHALMAERIHDEGPTRFARA